MYVDATNVGVNDRRSAAEIIRAVRTALQPLEDRLQRIQVDVHPSGDSHVCRLHAWSERGQTVVIESRATSRHQAVTSATDSLRLALERAPQRRRWAPLPSPTSTKPSPTSTKPSPTSTKPSPTSAKPSTPAVPLSGMPVAAPPGPASTGVAAAPACGAAGERRTDLTGDPSASIARHPRVLLALHELDPSGASLHWSGVLAEALHTDLDVCRVLPDMPATASLPPGPAWLDATRRLLAATRETRRWCEQTLPHAVVSERVIPGAADYAKEAGLLARRRGVEWIVVPAREGCGAATVSLARAAGCPVLVAREPTTRSTLLVATEVEGDNLPALRRAARLAIALHAPVSAFHDLRALSPRAELTPQVDALAQPWAQLQKEYLSVAPDQRLPEIDVLLAHGGDRVGALLQQARREDAEMIVLSLAASDPEGRSGAIASAVANDALRSVLIVPTGSANAELARSAEGGVELCGARPATTAERPWAARGRARIASARRAPWRTTRT